MRIDSKRWNAGAGPGGESSEIESGARTEASKNTGGGARSYAWLMHETVRRGETYVGGEDISSPNSRSNG